MENVDLLIRNARVFNSYFKRFEEADVWILDGRFFYIDAKKNADLAAKTVLDAAGKYMIPGLIDIHMHIESSMMTPGPFCRRLAACGVTTIVAEPHEIANVKGVEGIRQMIAAGNAADIDVYYGIPSSVPSTGANLETAGASIDFAAMKELLADERVICVGEIMNYRRIIRENDLEITKFLAYLREAEPRFVIEGHCPALTDLDLAKFLYLGIDSDHTEHSMEEIRQRFAGGMFVEVQEKMLSAELFALINAHGLHEHFGFVTDDTMADTLADEGHLDAVVRKAMRLGLTPEQAVYAATYTVARRMNLRDRGAIAPGKLADFCLLDDLAAFHLTDVYKEGRPIYQEGKPRAGTRSSFAFPRDFYHSVNVKPIEEADFVIAVPEDVDEVTVNVMEVRDGSTRTERKPVRMPVKDHRLVWEGSGCLLAAVFERHGINGNVGYGFITGDCLKRGAAATTYFHDHHNLFVAGGSALDMAIAARRIAALQGGIATARDGEVIAELPLPVCGILSELSVREIGAALKGVRRSLLDLGYVHYNPIMSLCTLGLPVSPALKLTDRGLVDVREGRVIPLYTADSAADEKARAI